MLTNLDFQEFPMPLKSSVALHKAGWGVESRKEYTMEEKANIKVHSLYTNLNVQVISLHLLKYSLQGKKEFLESIGGRKKELLFSSTKPNNYTGFSFELQFQRRTVEKCSSFTNSTLFTSSWKAGGLLLASILTTLTESTTLFLTHALRDFSLFTIIGKSKPALETGFWSYSAIFLPCASPPITYISHTISSLITSYSPKGAQGNADGKKECRKMTDLKNPPCCTKLRSSSPFLPFLSVLVHLRRKRKKKKKEEKERTWTLRKQISFQGNYSSSQYNGLVIFVWATGINNTEYFTP